MSSTKRQRGSIIPALAILLLGGVAALAGLIMPRQKSDSGDLVAAGKALGDRATSALNAGSQGFTSEAIEASLTPELSAAFENGVDAATFQDALSSEEWWAPFRKDGHFTVLLSDGKVMASLFKDATPLDVDVIVKEATSDRVASGFVNVAGNVYIAAAARLDKSPKAKEAHAVIVVGEPMPKDTLDKAAQLAGAAVGFTDGTRLLSAAGPDAARAAIATLAGKEAQGNQLSAQSLLSTPRPLPGGLWMWAVGTEPVASSAGNALTAYGPFALAAVLIVMGLVLLTRREPARPMESALPSTTTPIGHAKSPSITGENETTTLRAPEAGPVAGDPDRPSKVAVRPTELAPSGKPAPASAIDARPSVLGRYKLLEKIGEGGMAEIYRASLSGAEGFERQLVVKRLHPALLGFKEAVSQFIDEARLQSALVHSNIVPVFDFGRAGEDYFLALEYIEGRDLDRIVQRHVEKFGRPLSVPLAAHIVHEVLMALEFAHNHTDPAGKRMEIVHRDVSLGNVLVSYRGEVKLSDFGIAKAQSRVSKTQIGMVKGNTGFMAPEQARGETVDPRADVFSTGVVLFCCLAGHALYHSTGESPMNQLLRAAVGPEKTQFEKLRTFPPEVHAVLTKAIASDVNARYGSASEFAAALQPLATGSRDQLARMVRELFAEEQKASQDAAAANRGA
jgi:tRNA A-37 threonylcarbamoyl transferase component Bud32